MEWSLCKIWSLPWFYKAEDKIEAPLTLNENISEDRKLDFDIWYNKDKNIIIKISYKKFGDWEYRLKNIK